MTFLSDAHQRGMLRQIGAMYATAARHPTMTVSPGLTDPVISYCQTTFLKRAKIGASTGTKGNSGKISSLLSTSNSLRGK
jgi:hypothetical protein